MNKERLKPWIEFVVFQALWFATVCGAAAGRALIGPTMIWIWIMIGLKPRPRVMAEFFLVLAAALLGYALDSVLVLTGFLAFPGPAQSGEPSPFWMASLWALFAFSLTTTMRVFIRHRVLGTALAAVAAPFSYWAGERLGAVDLTRGFLSAAVVGLEWCLAMPLLLFLAYKSLPIEIRWEIRTGSREGLA